MAWSLIGMRSLLGKDLRILRRSPALVALLIIYPIAIAVLIGLALSSSPAPPRVAFLNEIPPSQATIQLGSETIRTTRYEKELFEAIQPVPVQTEAQAIADVRNGTTIAALIIPPQLPEELASASQTAYVKVIYNGNAVNQSLVENSIESKLAQANALLAAQLSRVADSYIDLLLTGGRLDFLGASYQILGLVQARDTLAAVAAHLPAASPTRRKVVQVENFAQIAVAHLGGSKSVIGAVAAPIGVHQQTLSGARTPLGDYAVAVAVAVSLMFVCILLGSGMLALEREEGTLGRLRRGLVSGGVLLSEKALLAAIVGAAVSFAMLAGIGLFVPLDWGRVALWLAAMATGAVAFAMLGVAMGALVRDVRAASLFALFVSLPLVFLALVPPATVSSGLFDAIRVVSAVFPFKAALEALDAAINQSQPSLLEALGHLAALIVGFGVLARLSLRA
ncbi:MAG: ABC transporter permease [Solirubrobacteraceae bacterium]|jgi:ABC-2 type transport system permease protein